MSSCNFNRRGQLNIENSVVENYLMRAMKNLTLKSFSKSKKRQVFLEDFMQYVQMTKSVHPDASILQKELNELLFQDINHLPEKMREVFLLSRQELMTHKQIAAHLGLKESTVKKQIQNALKILKTNLGTSFTLYLLIVLIDK
jgi:RNA polymerase sigma factor (sigma-70 family)